MEWIKTAAATAVVVIGLGAIVMLCAGDNLPASVASGQPEAKPDFVPGEVVVEFDHSSADAQLSAVGAVGGASVVQHAYRGNAATVSVPVGQEETYRQMLEAQPGIASVELNVLWQPFFIPDDEYYSYQWHLHMLQLEEAWDITRGRDTVVAILDTGVAFEDYSIFERAPDFDGTTFVNPYDAVSGDVHPNDDQGHGTHVAGTVSQTSNDGYGTAGVANHAAIMPVKVCVIIGCPGSAIADGIVWAVDHGADVINLSLGGSQVMDEEREALAYAEQHGVVVVAATGNGGEDGVGDATLDYPSAIGTVVAVGAVDINSVRTGYSNYGTGEGKVLDIVAPGGDLDTDYNGDKLGDGVVQQTFAFSCSNAPFNYRDFLWCFYQGTSMASPHVAGVAALLLAEYPSLTPAEVREVLFCSAKDLGPEGHDEGYGAGLVQAYDALKDEDTNGVPDCLGGGGPADVTFVMESGTLTPGGTREVSFTANASAPGISAFTIDILYDDEVVRPLTCAPHSTVICNKDFDAGVVRLTGSAVSGLVGGITLADINFEALGADGQSSALDVVVNEVVDANINDITDTVDITDGTLVIQDGPEGVAGDTDCDVDVDTVDGLMVLRNSAGMTTGDCIAMGDVDCDDDIDTVDALMLMRHVASLPVNVPSGCVPIGQARA